MKKGKVFTVPNILSVIRLIMVPFICVFYYREQYIVAVIMIVVSGFTDLFDGLIARTFNQISNVGKILDPLADKITMAAVFFSVMLKHHQVILVFVVMAVKELGMLIGAYILFKKGKRPSESKIWGKVATTLLYVMLCLILASDVVNQLANGTFVIPDAVMWVMAGICCVAMVLAVLQYYPIFVGILKGKYNLKTEKFEGDEQ